MSRRLTILQLVPRLKPAICGVGDYALELARALRDHHGIDTRFLVADPAWRHGATVDGFDVAVLPSRTPNALSQSIAASESEAVVVQYSGYGFQKRGAPMWLPLGLRHRGTPPVVTMFHELYATGPMRSSAFWLSYVQRWVTRKLAAMSHQVWSNRQDSARWLESHVPTVRGRVTVLPVFSNLGEDPGAPPPSRRPSWLAMFGYQSGGNAWYWERLRNVISTLKPERVIALGREIPGVATACGSVPYEQTGVISAEALSGWLSRCRFGYLSYAPAFLGKSSTLAAYLAHGVCTILADEASVLPEGLELNRHMLHAPRLAADADIDWVAANGAAWYAAHNRAATAESYASQLLRVAG